MAGDGVPRVMYDLRGGQPPAEREDPFLEGYRRSAVTLKMLDHFENGALVAAPTSSLPEAIGGPRNWDYRYAWIRDAAFSVYAFRCIGLAHESRGFLGWVLDAVARHGEPRDSCASPMRRNAYTENAASRIQAYR